jgi:tetratricopeptide (TPR) repeat protein
LSALEGSVKEQIEAAWSDLQAVSQKSGVNPEELKQAYGQMGKVYHTYNFSDGAAACYQNARALAPREFDWPYYLGLLYQEKGEVKEAITYLKIAQELAPNEIPVLVNLAEAYLASGQSESAKALFEKSLALDNSLAAAMAGIGKIALSKGDYGGAIRYLEAAVKLQPQATSLHYPLAMAYRGVGNVEKALAHLREQGPGKPKIPDPLADDLERLKKGEMILWRRGNQAMNDGRYAEAVQLYEQMVALANDDPLPRIYLGNALAAAGNLKGAIEQYEQVLRLRSDNSTAHYNYGVILLQQHSEQEALEHFRAAVASDPGFKLAHFQLANLLMRNTHCEEAIPHYTRVIELSPDNEFARLMKSMALIRLRRYAAAQAELEEGEASLPESTDLASALARLLAACPDKSVRDGPRALRLAEKLLKAHPSPEFELVETYGMALASVGRHSEAAELQRQMLATVESAGRSDLTAVIKRNLSLYEQGQSCPLPWRDDDPIFAPQPGKMMLTVPKENLRMAREGPVSP